MGEGTGNRSYHISYHVDQQKGLKCYNGLLICVLLLFFFKCRLGDSKMWFRPERWVFVRYPKGGHFSLGAVLLPVTFDPLNLWTQRLLNLMNCTKSKRDVRLCVFPCLAIRHFLSLLRELISLLADIDLVTLHSCLRPDVLHVWDSTHTSWS